MEETIDAKLNSIYALLTNLTNHIIPQIEYIQKYIIETRTRLEEKYNAEIKEQVENIEGQFCTIITMLNKSTLESKFDDESSEDEEDSNKQVIENLNKYFKNYKISDDHLKPMSEITKEYNDTYGEKITQKQLREILPQTNIYEPEIFQNKSSNLLKIVKKKNR